MSPDRLSAVGWTSILPASLDGTFYWEGTSYCTRPPSFCIGGGLCFFSGDRGGPSSCTRGYFSQLYLTLCTCPWHREPHAGLQGAAGSLSLRGTRLSLGAAVELDILMHYMDGWRKSFLLLLMLQSALAQINPVP